MIISPLLREEAIQLSQSKGLYRKQILPRGKFNYEGEVIDFDQIAQDAKEAFDQGALDQVAFQLAESSNRHNFDPKNYRGEIKAIELAEDGTYAICDFSHYPDMQELVTKNPKFGVSAQIERNLKRGDGKEFRHAFSHVLGTLNPKVTGMKPWEALALSKTDDEVIDLTDVEVTSAVTDTKKKDEESVTLSKTEYDRFKGFLDSLDAAETLNLSNEDSDDKPEENPAIKLANERAESALRLARESEVKLAASEWKARRVELVNAGVPPVMLSKADALMARPDSDVKPIQLSNSESLDPKAIVLSVLEEAKGTIDLSASKGHEYNGSEDGDENDPAWKAFRDSFFADQF